jgi:hypothetical protein
MSKVHLNIANRWQAKFKRGISRRGGRTKRIMKRRDEKIGPGFRVYPDVEQ